MSVPQQSSEGAITRRRRRIAIAIALVIAAVLVVADVLWLSPILIRENLEDFRDEGAQINLTSGDELVLNGLRSEAILSNGLSPVDLTVRFSGSRLHPDSATLLEMYLGARPPESGDILFETDAFDERPAPGEEPPGSCRTLIAITPDPKNTRKTLDLVFSPPISSSDDEEPSSRASMKLTPEGGGLQIFLSVVTPEESTAAEGCHKVLEVGGESYGLPAPLSLDFEVAPGGMVIFEPTESLGDDGVAPFGQFVVGGLKVRRHPHRDALLWTEAGDDAGQVNVEELIIRKEGRLRAVLTGKGWLKGESAYLPGQNSLITRFNKRLDSDPILKVLWLGLHGSVLLLVGKYVIQEPAKIAWKWLQTVRATRARASAPPTLKAGGVPHSDEPDASGQGESTSSEPPTSG